MTLTQTRTSASTHTRTRAYELMKRRLDPDIQQLASRGFITRATAAQWIQDLRFLAQEDAMVFFDVIFSHLDERLGGYRYTFVSDGTVTANEFSGGMSLWGLPNGVEVSIVIKLRSDVSQVIWDELESRGWGKNGVSLGSNGVRDRAFSYQGFGAIREVFGGI